MDNSLNQTTYELLKKDILTLNLKPGEGISAAKLAERYSVSRTPAREALVRLFDEGLVKIVPQSKSFISKINLERARQEWFVRNSLELAMAEEFISKVRDEDIEQMKMHNENMLKLAGMPDDYANIYEYQMEDNRFHAVAYKVTGQGLAAEVIATTMAHYSRLRFLTDIEDFYRERTVKGHNRLLEYIENRDIERYKSGIKIHLHHIIDDIEELSQKYPMYFES